MEKEEQETKVLIVEEDRGEAKGLSKTLTRGYGIDEEEIRVVGFEGRDLGGVVRNLDKVPGIVISGRNDNGYEEVVEAAREGRRNVYCAVYCNDREEGFERRGGYDVFHNLEDLPPGLIGKLNRLKEEKSGQAIPRVLIVEDNERVGNAMKLSAESSGYNSELLLLKETDMEEVRERIDEYAPDLVVSDGLHGDYKEVARVASDSGTYCVLHSGSASLQKEADIFALDKGQREPDFREYLEGYKRFLDEE